METDTEKLLKECDAGCKTAVNSIREVLDKAQSDELRQLLKESLTTHEKLGDDIHKLLREQNEPGKEPSGMARMMSKMKIDMKMLQENSDHTIATLMIDGCSMGIKSLCEYVNQYAAADGTAKDMAARLIDAEDKFAERLRAYL